MRDALTRRASLAPVADGAVALCAPAGAVAPGLVAAGHPDAAILALWARFETAWAEFAELAKVAAGGWSDPREMAADAALNRMDALGERVAEAPALTPAGLAAKLRVAWSFREEHELWMRGATAADFIEDRLAWVAIEAAKRMGGVPDFPTFDHVLAAREAARA